MLAEWEDTHRTVRQSTQMDASPRAYRRDPESKPGINENLLELIAGTISIALRINRRQRFHFRARIGARSPANAPDPSPRDPARPSTNGQPAYAALNRSGVTRRGFAFAKCLEPR